MIPQIEPHHHLPSKWRKGGAEWRSIAAFFGVIFRPRHRTTGSPPKGGVNRVAQDGEGCVIGYGCASGETTGDARWRKPNRSRNDLPPTHRLNGEKSKRRNQQKPTPRCVQFSGKNLALSYALDRRNLPTERRKEIFAVCARKSSKDSPANKYDPIAATLWALPIPSPLPSPHKELE